jgi:hypothetical protein
MEAVERDRQQNEDVRDDENIFQQRFHNEEVSFGSVRDRALHIPSASPRS